MRASIIITNYNLREFVLAAIESARAQTYRDVEIIVVDDGSTDGSQQELRRAAEADPRVQVFLKENGGQASAMNEGFAHSTGEVVLFLDADDLLMHDTVERAVDALRAQPEAAKVHYRLEVIDRDGRALGWQLPSNELPAGNLAADVIREFGLRTFGWPPTSGAAYPRRTLKALLPIPEETYRICADEYLNYLSPLLGSIVALAVPAARYRVHGSNNYAMGQIDERFASRIRESMNRTRATRAHQLRLLKDVTGSSLRKQSNPVESLRSYAIMRLVSLKLGPGGHPIAGDSVWKAAKDAAYGCLRASRNPGTSALRRLMAAAWIVAVCASPPRAARKLIATKYQVKRQRVPAR